MPPFELSFNFVTARRAQPENINLWTGSYAVNMLGQMWSVKCAFLKIFRNNKNGSIACDSQNDIYYDQQQVYKYIVCHSLVKFFLVKARKLLGEIKEKNCGSA